MHNQITYQNQATTVQVNQEKHHTECRTECHCSIITPRSKIKGYYGLNNVILDTPLKHIQNKTFKEKKQTYSRTVLWIFTLKNLGNLI